MDQDATPPNATETSSENEEQCMVCLNAMHAGDDHARLWSCTCCRKQCHMLCIFQWTLRLSLNESRNFSAFSCPGCRTQHAISTLPGFEQHTRERRSVRIAGIQASTADILREAFGLTPANTQGQRDEQGDGAVIEVEAVEEEDEEEEEEEEDDVQENGRWMFSLSTEKFYLDIHTVNVNIHSR